MPKNKDNSSISSINAKELALKDIFCDKYIFSIPNYQRPYSWDEENCLQFLDDIQTFAFKNIEFEELPPYFFGSAVIIKKTNRKESQIVDGQQRLTTLIIFLSALRHAINDEKNKKSISKMIFQAEDELLGNSETIRLKTRVRDQDFFNKYIQEENGLKTFFNNQGNITFENDAQKRIVRNTIAYLDAFKEKKYSQKQLKLLAKYLIQKCVIVIVSSTDEDMAFKIFNVLNDRGKDLTISDILKSEILEKIEQKEQFHYTEIWENCETELGVEAFKDIFSHIRAIHIKKKAEKSTINEIRENVIPNYNSKSFIDNILSPYTTAFNEILKKSFKSNFQAEEINGFFDKISRVAHTDWVPPAIQYVAKNRNNPKNISNFLNQLEKLTLSMEASKIPLNKRIERYAKVMDYTETEKDLYSEGSPLLLTENDRSKIISVLTSKDLYGKRLVKPILTKIEEQMNDGSISIKFSDLNIEHVLPQTPTDYYWTSRFTIENRVNFTDNLGNLSLISVRKNSQAKNYKFSKKIDVYFKKDGKASNLAMINELSDKEDWTVDIIKQRNIKLLNLFLSYLGMVEYKQNT